MILMGELLQYSYIYIILTPQLILRPYGSSSTVVVVVVVVLVVLAVLVGGVALLMASRKRFPSRYGSNRAVAEQERAERPGSCSSSN